MKIFKNIVKYSFFILLFTSASCNNSDEQELPTGDRSFYCYIDGELFVPKGNPNISTTPSTDGLRISITDEFYQIEAKDYSKYTVFINIKDVDSSVNEIDLADSSGSFYTTNINHAIVRKNGVKYLSKDNSGTIIFTENTEDNVKGTFQFTLYNENDESDTIQVTNGHFDD